MCHLLQNRLDYLEIEHILPSTDNEVAMLARPSDGQTADSDSDSSCDCAVDEDDNVKAS